MFRNISELTHMFAHVHWLVPSFSMLLLSRVSLEYRDNHIFNDLDDEAYGYGEASVDVSNFK